jgi:hypothetical protein
MANRVTEVSRVFVTEGENSSAGVSNVPQSPQNCFVSGLSALHFGHGIPMTFPYYGLNEEYQFPREESILGGFLSAFGQEMSKKRTKSFSL